MCTLLLAHQVWPQTPLWVGANRDEMLARPAAPPAVRAEGARRVLAPVDLQAGGTWLGLNDGGVFAGITNRAGVLPDPARRSRGGLVFAALAHSTAEAGAAAVAATDPASVNPFHLLVADRRGVFLVWSDGARVRLEPQRPGFVVLTERSLGAAPASREARLREELAPLARASAPDEDALAALLRRHDGEPFAGTCVHVPERGYGTRSATRIALGVAIDDARFLHADGPPCTTPFADLGETARALLRGEAPR